MSEDSIYNDGEKGIAGHLADTANRILQFSMNVQSAMGDNKPEGEVLLILTNLRAERDQLNDYLREITGLLTAEMKNKLSPQPTEEGETGTVEHAVHDIAHSN